MDSIKRILCPVDLSPNGMAAMETAAAVASANGAHLTLFYVAESWMPDESMLGNEFVSELVDDQKKEFYALAPSDTTVDFDRQFVYGNPGPEIVRKARDYDLIVLSTHGRTGFRRLLMGSVAEYVVRHAPCPVLTVRATDRKESESPDAIRRESFVTRAMRQVTPIHSWEKIQDVIDSFARTGDTAAPVVDEAGRCIGILTETDIARYQELKQRVEAGDETVVDEVFETDKYGQRRAANCDFDKVRRHMTSPVQTVTTSQSCEQAAQVWRQHPGIHHLVVVDDRQRPVGVLAWRDHPDWESCLAISETGKSQPRTSSDAKG